MGSSKKKAEPDDALPKVHVLDDLEQVKVLADPLRLRILEALVEAARTTKQVAEILGEKPTKLYHHVDALERIGVIRLEKTRQKRGTLEKYYRAIAYSFRTSPELFASTPEIEEGWPAVGASVLEKAVDDLRRMKPEPGDEAHCDKAMFAGLRVRASRADVEELYGDIERWLEKAQALDEAEGEEEVDYRFTVAFYPAAEKG